jgi:hypothetical protein
MLKTVLGQNGKKIFQFADLAQNAKFWFMLFITVFFFFFSNQKKVFLKDFLLNIMKMIERNNTISISKQVLNECNAVYYFRVSHNFIIFKVLEQFKCTALIDKKLINKLIKKLIY